MFQRKIFVFDIDQTILSDFTSDYCLNQCKKTISQYDPFMGQLGEGCYTLHKNKLSQIMQSIIANGDDIAFITSGTLPKQHIEIFFKHELNTQLNEFEYFNDIEDKTPYLVQIANKGNYDRHDVIFIDNRKHHITPARNEGFTAIYADNNSKDKTNGELYLAELNKIIEEQARARARARAINNIRTELNNLKTYKCNTFYEKKNDTKWEKCKKIDVFIDDTEDRLTKFENGNNRAFDDYVEHHQNNITALKQNRTSAKLLASIAFCLIPVVGWLTGIGGLLQLACTQGNQFLFWKHADARSGADASNIQYHIITQLSPR